MTDQAKQAVRIAVVGSSGFIGRAHIRHILDEEDAEELVALVDTAPSLLADAKKYGVAHFWTIEECLEAYESGGFPVDAVILASPTQTHVSMSQLFENTGLAVLIEKPLSTNGRDGQTLLALSTRDTQSVYMVGHHRRHSPYVKAVKQVVDRKKLGDIVAVNGVWVMRKSEEYFDISWHTKLGVGGVLLTNAIHDLDMLQYWLGDITEVFAFEGTKHRPFDVDSTVQLSLKFSSGAVGSFLLSDCSASHLSWEAGTGDNPVFSRTGADFLTIFGTGGSLSVPSLTRYHYDDKPERENWNFPLQTDDHTDMLESGSAFTHQLKHFIAVSRREKEPNCSVEDGLKAVLVVDAIFKSIETARPVSVERL